MATYNALLSYLSWYMAKILGASKVTVRYQVTIPEEVRKQMKIEVGQTLVFAEEQGKVVLKTEL